MTQGVPHISCPAAFIDMLNNPHTLHVLFFVALTSTSLKQVKTRDSVHTLSTAISAAPHDANISHLRH